MRIVVAMSGGVDSSVAAALLKEQGHDVIGLFMRNGIVHRGPSAKPFDSLRSLRASTGETRDDGQESAPGRDTPEAGGAKQGCCSAADARDARRVADRLDVPFYAIDFSAEFRGVIDNFVAEYARGRTPNPCIECNQRLKFGRLLDYADAAGAAMVATGHYARVEDGRLKRGLDGAKDQSYVLCALRRDQVARTILPIGGMRKEEVREAARRFQLPVSDKPESMEICFVPDNDYRRLVGERLAPSPGPIVDTSGKKLGEHTGVQNFTVGQREGLGIALGRPAYVVSLDADTRTVVVGFADSLLARGLVACHVNWLVPEPSSPVECQVQIRAHHEPAPSLLHPAGDSVRVEFREPARAVTPGQAAAFYDGDTVLGGGWIESATA